MGKEKVVYFLPAYSTVQISFFEISQSRHVRDPITPYNNVLYKLQGRESYFIP